MEPWMYKARFWDTKEMKSTVHENPEMSYETEYVTSCMVSVEGVHTTKEMMIIFNDDSGTVTFNEEIVKISDIRYITTNTCSQGMSGMIIVCFRKDLAKSENIYIRCTDEVTTITVLNTFRRRMFNLVEHLEPSHERDTAVDWLEPLLVQTSDVKIVVAETESVHKFIIVINEEQIALYKDAYSKSADYVMYFFEEETAWSINKITSNLTGVHVVAVVGTFTVLHTQEDDGNGILKVLRKIRAKPQRVIGDPSNLVSHRCQQRKVDEKNPRVSVFPELMGARALRTSTRRPVLPEMDDEHMEAAALNTSATEYLKSLQEQLHNALQWGETSPDCQAIWGPSNEQILKVLSEHFIPEKDVRSGGFDPNSIDHFKRCLDDIDDKLFQQDYEEAISSLRNAREIFQESTRPEMKDILEVDDYQLIKMLYFKSLFTSL